MKHEREGNGSARFLIRKQTACVVQREGYVGLVGGLGATFHP